MGDAPTSADAVAAWDALASFWDQRAGASGGEIHRLLIAPSLHRLLGLAPGETILDVGCGNGVVARELAMAGAVVVACDASSVFVDLARQRSEGLAIDYHVVDATDEQDLAALGPNGFEGIVASMVLMDLPDPSTVPSGRSSASTWREGGHLRPPPVLQQPVDGVAHRGAARSQSGELGEGVGLPRRRGRPSGPPTSRCRTGSSTARCRRWSAPPPRPASCSTRSTSRCSMRRRGRRAPGGSGLRSLQSSSPVSVQHSAPPPPIVPGDLRHLITASDRLRLASRTRPCRLWGST